jgi:sugar lactone lactonase YvrE
MTGPFIQNEALASVEHLVPGIGEGPEDVTRGPDSFFYTGLQDGRIMRFRADGSGAETFASTDGRPLGMQFDGQGNLIVADAFEGLLSVAPDGTLSVLTDRVDGQKILYADDLDIAADGTIWFSDASQRFDDNNNMLDFLELRPTGRLLSYDSRTGETRVRLEGLMFANGVALGPGDAYVLVNETFAARTVRLWLKGEKAEQRDVFLEGLPGYPDNLSYNGRGTFWIALTAPRDNDLEGFLFPRPFLRKMLVRLLGIMGSEPPDTPYGWVIGVDTEGEIIHNLHDPAGGFGSITSVNEYEGQLYLGSIATSSVGRFRYRIGG